MNFFQEKQTKTFLPPAIFKTDNQLGIHGHMSSILRKLKPFFENMDSYDHETFSVDIYLSILLLVRSSALTAGCTALLQDKL